MFDLNSPFWLMCASLALTLQTWLQKRWADKAAEKVAEKVETARKVLEANTAKTAAKVEENNKHLVKVSQDTVSRLETIQSTADTVHVLVNNARSQLLKELAEVRRLLADRSQDPEEIEAARKAEKTYREDRERQLVAGA